jgi:hypothetical protein
MLSVNLVQYLYEAGKLSLHDLYELVEIGEISEGDFHEITRMWYHAIKGTRGCD